MRKLREILRLGLSGELSIRNIARSVRVSRFSVAAHLAQATKSRLTLETINGLNDEELIKLLSRGEIGRPKESRPLPDWEYVHRELGKKSVTLQLLWQEYRENHPNGYQATQFYEHYRKWRGGLDLSMRQTHKPGEKMFADYAGQTIPIYDAQTGLVKDAQIFVGVLGLSNYTYSEASFDQSQSSWIMAHVRAFEYFEMVPHIVVQDNLKSGVTKPCRYEPDLNPSYQDMAAHYGTAILPARVRHPRDKAKVEVGVQVVERWILASLRNRKFFSLEELNEAIREKLEILNTRPFKKLKGSRREWFLLFEKQQMLPLPEERYVYAAWKPKATVNIDYHVEFEKHYYSVPHQYRQKKVDIRYTQITLEIFCRGKRIASHVRDTRMGKHTTIPEHMPKSHRAYLEWTPTRIINWAGTIGSSAKTLAETILKTKPHPEQGYRSCLGLIRLGKRFGNARLEKACQRAIQIGGRSYKSVLSILESGIDLKKPESSRTLVLFDHGNIRGADYYSRSLNTALENRPASNNPGSSPSRKNNGAVMSNEGPCFDFDASNKLKNGGTPHAESSHPS